jgi:hypothetical protein
MGLASKTLSGRNLPRGGWRPSMGLLASDGPGKRPRGTLGVY